ncbi:MAG: S8 family serine peptidase [Novosphingobium sp.]
MALMRYFILEQDQDALAAAGAPVRRGGLGFGPRSTVGAAPHAATAPGVKVATAELSASEAASERKRPGVRIVGSAMPIRLIAPLARSSPPAGPSSAATAWGIEATGADRSALDGKGVTVAVLDTGLKRDHPAFAGRAEGFFKVQDFTDGAGTAEDINGHGSHCAGTIFGQDVAGTRIGIARGIDRALIAKVLPDDRPGDSAMLFDALNWASREGAAIVSMSLGFDFPGMVEQLVESEGMPQAMAVSNALVIFSQNLRAFDAIMATFRAGEPFGRNMLVVGAAGNESQRDADTAYRISASLPAAAGGVVSVAAYGRAEDGYRIAPFSNTDPQIAAPGVDILSVDLGGGLGEMSGTSQACPHIAGLAALWWQKLADAGETPTPDRVREKMFAAATAAKLPPDADEVERGRGRALAPT